MMLSSVIAWVFGVLSLIVGVLNIAPRLGEATWQLQMAMPEIPQYPILFGLLTAVLGGITAQPLVIGFGLVGAALSAWELLLIPSTRRDHLAQMRKLTGESYPQNIPTDVPTTPVKWSFDATMRGAWKKYDITIEKDVVYVTRPSRALKCDIYRPNRPPVRGDKYPAVLVFHPGAWSLGDKSWYFTPHDSYLASLGYVVFDCQYRFVQETGWPTQLDDARDAIRWVKANAATYNIDPERIAVLGRSSGGHVALSAAYRATGDYADTAVRAAIGIYPPVNLTIIAETPGPAIRALFDGDPSDVKAQAAYEDGSPLFYADKNSPPTLLIHGKRDGVVHYIHSEQLRWALQRAGVPVGVLRLPWSHHSFDVSPIGIGAQMTQYHIDRFLAWSLYPDER